MNLNDITEQIKDQLKTTWGKIHDSAAYQQAIEKYEDMPGSQQKLIRVGGSILFVLFLLSPPISSILTAGELIEEFERKREITRELMRVVRDAANSPNIPQAPEISSLQSRIQQELQNDKLMPEQIHSIQAEMNVGTLVPKSLTTGSLSINLKSLNLRQILDVAYRAASTSPTVKMTELELNSSPGKPGYFDMTSKLVLLKAPEPPKIELEDPKDNKARFKKRPKSDGDEAPDEEE